MVVTVNEMGQLVCSYLGTDPTSLSPVLTTSPHYNIQVGVPENGYPYLPPLSSS